MEEAGSVIGGRYRLVRRVGEGAMAAIWEAEHLTLGRPVAIKFLHTVGSPQSEAHQRFVREARVAAKIKHRNVVDIVDFGVTDGDHRPYMVMELLEGKPLSEQLEERTRLSIADAARIVSEVLRGLAAVHDTGIVHRDLKPDNIFLVNDEDGPFPKLVDFGLSRRVGRGDMTAEGIILGTPDYMSPEQARGERVIDARTDIYSMGVILYELVTGHMPFDGGSLAELLTHVVEGKYVPLSERLLDAPPLLVDIVERAMHKDKNQRFANARDMRAAMATANLAPFQHGESGLMVVEPHATHAKNPATSRSQTGANAPSGLFRDPDASERRSTRDEDDATPTPSAPAAAPALDNEATHTSSAADTFDDAVDAKGAALAPTLPAAPAPVLPPKVRADATPLRRRDDSAGMFKVGVRDDAPKRRSGIWAPVVAIIALASIAGGVIVYWLQTGTMPLADLVTAPLEADAPDDSGEPDGSLDDSAGDAEGEEDAAGSEPSDGPGATVDDPAPDRPTKVRRRRPRRRHR